MIAYELFWLIVAPQATLRITMMKEERRRIMMKIEDWHKRKIYRIYILNPYELENVLIEDMKTQQTLMMMTIMMKKT